MDEQMIQMPLVMFTDELNKDAIALKLAGRSKKLIACEITELLKN
jgi:hypothetical protein